MAIDRPRHVIFDRRAPSTLVALYGDLLGLSAPKRSGKCGCRGCGRVRSMTEVIIRAVSFIDVDALPLMQVAVGALFRELDMGLVADAPTPSIEGFRAAQAVGDLVVAVRAGSVVGFVRIAGSPRAQPGPAEIASSSTSRCSRQSRGKPRIAVACGPNSRDNSPSQSVDAMASLMVCASLSRSGLSRSDDSALRVQPSPA